jgi:hypothetical protein
MYVLVQCMEYRTCISYSSTHDWQALIRALVRYDLIRKVSAADHTRAKGVYRFKNRVLQNVRPLDLLCANRPSKMQLRPSGSSNDRFLCFRLHTNNDCRFNARDCTKQWPRSWSNRHPKTYQQSFRTWNRA